MEASHRLTALRQHQVRLRDLHLLDLHHMHQLLLVLLLVLPLLHRLPQALPPRLLPLLQHLAVEHHPTVLLLLHQPAHRPVVEATGHTKCSPAMVLLAQDGQARINGWTSSLHSRLALPT